MSSASRCLLTVAVVVCEFLNEARPFSLDGTDTVIRYQGAAKAEFGYSLSFHSSGSSKIVLVGAPRASYSNASWTGGGTVKQPGVLFSCPFSTTSATPGPCQELAVDTLAPKRLNGNATIGYQWEVKDNMRMGQTVLSSGPDGPVMVCASRYGHYTPCMTTNPNTVYQSGACFGNALNESMYDNIGKCVVLPSDLALTGMPTDFAPSQPAFPVTLSHQKFMKGYFIPSTVYIELGWSGFVSGSVGFQMTATTKLGNTGRFPLERFVISAPTMTFTVGQYWMYNPRKPAQLPTQQSVRTFPALDSGTSTGVAEGDFNGDSVLEMAVSRPFVAWTNQNCGCNNSYQGDVWIQTLTGASTDAQFANFHANTILVITGQQFGEGFGYTMLPLDIDKDGTSELLVSAPYYMDFTRSSQQNAFDFGRVYVYSSKLKAALTPLPSVKDSLNFKTRYSSRRLEDFDVALEGQPGSRFGWSLASVGDVDRDGYQDIAVGAPGEYINDQRSGAVYLYLGSPSGLSRQHSQRIEASSRGALAFGTSLSYGWDIDNNGYNDIAVGASESGQAYVFRSRPVIIVSLTLTMPSDIDATNRSCDYPGAGQRACFLATICGQYSRPPKATRAVIEYTLGVDGNFVMLNAGRTTVLSTVTSTITMTTPGQDVCVSQMVYVQTNIPNLCRSGNVTLTQWKLVDRPNTPADLAPVLVRNHPAVTPINKQISLVPLCASCRPDVITNFAISGPASKVTSGVVSTTTVAVAVHNRGNQPACALAVEMHVNAVEVVFSSVPESLWLCSERGRPVLICQPAVQNPFYGAIGPGHSVTFTSTIRSSRTLFPTNYVRIPINATARSGNPENGTVNNPSTAHVAVLRQASLAIAVGDELAKSVTLVEDILNTKPVAKIGDLPFSLASTFQLRNSGPSVSTATQIIIKYPIQSSINTNTEAQSMDLYYLTAVEASSQGVLCNATALINARTYDLSSVKAPNSTVKYYEVQASSLPSQRPSDVYKECSGLVCSVAIVCSLPAQNPNTVQQVRLLWRVYTTTVQAMLSTRDSAELAVSAAIGNTAAAEGYTAQTAQATATRSTEYATPATSNTEETNPGIIVGVVIGVIAFVAIVVLVLYKTGFFNRKKPEMASNRPKNAVDGTEPQSKPEEATAKEENEDM